jgi:Zn-dependent protease with chaperone function
MALVAYAACVGMLGPRVLGRAGWTARAPLLAIVTYLAAGWSVVAAVGLAGLTLAVHATALGGGLSQLIGACVAGRQPTVILTTAAVQALDPGQLDAVLAHERAHLTGRHHRLLALARIGREVLPFLPLMRDAEQQVTRLVELHADDAATRARDPRLLATALVVLATAAGPASALAAGATDSVQRIHRLLGPSEPLGRARRQLLRAAAAAGEHAAAW